MEHDAAHLHASAHAGNAQGCKPNQIKPGAPDPYHFFPPSLYSDGPTRVVPLDLSAELKRASPATGPDLCGNFIRIVAGEGMRLEPNATSLVFYVIRGKGLAQVGEESPPRSDGASASPAL